MRATITYRSKRQGFTLIEIMVVVAILGVLMAVAVPNFLKSRTIAQTKVCIENLAQLESAKQIFGVENNKRDGDAVLEDDLIGADLYIKEMPSCPSGGEYFLNQIGVTASCTIEDHEI